MTQDATRQPDQDPAPWGRHAAACEAAFEPLTDAFAARALDALMAWLGVDRAAVEAKFVRALEVAQGAGPVSLGAVAHAAFAWRTA